MATRGIDISRYQGKPDFGKLKSEVDFVILQAGFGRYASQKDSEFERSYSECKKNGISVGVYWYSYAKTAAEALAEAKACMNVIAGKQFEFPIYYDLEEGLGALGRSLVSAIAATFCNALEQSGYFFGDIHQPRTRAELPHARSMQQICAVACGVQFTAQLVGERRYVAEQLHGAFFGH